MTKDNKPTDAVNVLLKVTGQLAECQEQRDQLRDALSDLVEAASHPQGDNYADYVVKTMDAVAKARKLLADTSEQEG